MIVIEPTAIVKKDSITIINDDLNDCYTKINNLIEAEISNGSKDYDKEYIRQHVSLLTS